MRELSELGAQPLVLTMPIHGGWYDRCGITYNGRLAYYRKLREITARYHTAVVDFADHDADRSFTIDNMTHPSPSGFVYCCQVYDGFFHDVVPRPSKLPAAAPAARAATAAGVSHPGQLPDRSRKPSEAKP